ncbi:hypothetical protein Btru_057408 [Bulinus truncatus]|nr:hypothetical protein Btru_057408 [Bulinus truncatus]
MLLPIGRLYAAADMKVVLCGQQVICMLLPIGRLYASADRKAVSCGQQVVCMLRPIGRFYAAADRKVKKLVEYLGSKKDFPPERCTKLQSQSEAELRDNFIGINVYYESMFSLRLTDVAEIYLATFLSNLGGCVGLWIGVSVLSIVELLHLFVSIIWRIVSGIKLPNRSVPSRDGA